MTWKYIMLHCTATPAHRVVTREDIDRWHRQRGFRCIGYHYIIHQNGRVEEGRPLTQTGAHCKGYNSTAIGIAYIGGTDAKGTPADTRTPAQKEAIKALINRLRMLFGIERIMGHNEVSNKACPCFNVGKEYTL